MIQGNTANHNAGSGIVCNDCSDTKIKGNIAHDNHDGIIVIGGTDNIISNNKANNNFESGIQLAFGATFNNVINNTTNVNNEYGIEDEGSDNNNKNRCKDNGIDGSNPDGLCSPQGNL